MTDFPIANALSQPLYRATLPQAVSRFFRKYATFTGRASRSEYWWVVLPIVSVQLILSGFGVNVGARTGTTAADGSVSFGAGAIIFFVALVIFNLGIIVPGIAVTVRRLHDGNYSGMFYLFTLVGLSIIVVILAALHSNPEGARFDAQ
jgi:uncharacterized membrane protein YhaH (DUF805 family)